MKAMFWKVQAVKKHTHSITIHMFSVIHCKHQAHCCTRTCLPRVAFSVNELCEYFFEATIKLTPTPSSCDCQSDINLKESNITQI